MAIKDAGLTVAVIAVPVIVASYNPESIEDKIASIKSELFITEQKIEKQERLLISEK
jgi:hypothetical protein